MSEPLGERRRQREGERAAQGAAASTQPTRRQRREAERAEQAGESSTPPEPEYRATGRTASAPPTPPARIVPRAPARRRPGWLVPVLAACAALVVALVVVLAFGAVPDTAEAPDGLAPPVAAGTDSSLLVTVVDTGGDISGSALLASGQDRASALLVPSRLLVDVPSGGRVPLRDAFDTGEEAPARAVGDALEVRVDGTWVLTTNGLAQLVDALGGVVVDVDVQVDAGDVALAPGPGQTLGGGQAAAFAGQLSDGEAEPARLARFDQVLSGVLGRLPDDGAAVEEQLTALGGESRTTLDVGELADVLAGVARHVADGTYAATVLPVAEISTGAQEVLYGLDDGAVTRLLADRFAGVRREGAGQSARVLVQNGAGTPGLGEQARDALVEAGFRYVGGGNADTVGRPTTVVAIASDDPGSRALGTEVAAALGLGPEVVAVGQDAPTLADVVVVLGVDFAERVAAGSP